MAKKTPACTWLNDEIQFPRLLSEIIAVGLEEEQWDELLESMDLESDELSELFDRAQAKWERIKSRSLKRRKLTAKIERRIESMGYLK